LAAIAGPASSNQACKHCAELSKLLALMLTHAPIGAAMSELRLGVNIDHVATLRQARYATMPESKNAEPDPIVAAAVCERAGAHGIVAHLRSDRRHMQDRDIERLRENIMTKLNLEMGNTPEIVDVALRIVPDEVCLVPEKREEITTEGGLNVVTQRTELEATIKRLQVAGIRVSLFIDPDLEQVDAAGDLGVEMVELHTGKLANAFAEKIKKQELENLQAAAKAASEHKLQVNAGHGINYTNIALVHKVPHLAELNIGHSIISRAMFVGLETAVREMLAAMENYRG
jgi:pyridoxine 5-phosphate synthase